MNTVNFEIPSVTPLSPVEFGLNLAICVMAAYLLRYVYVRKSISLSGKYHIGSVIPMLATITFLVIMIVKSSLALSLGLVGALSIVRFRTPIKEPEELIYLFLAIALGLGYGAGQTAITTIVFGVIIATIIMWSARSAPVRAGEFNLMIDWSDGACTLDGLLEVITEHTQTAELRKYVSRKGGFSVFVKVNLSTPSDMSKVEKSVLQSAPSAILTFSEARLLQ
jgi:hypothetical protein